VSSAAGRGETRRVKNAALFKQGAQKPPTEKGLEGAAQRAGKKKQSLENVVLFKQGVTSFFGEKFKRACTATDRVKKGQPENSNGEPPPIQSGSQDSWSLSRKGAGEQPRLRLVTTVHVGRPGSPQKKTGGPESGRTEKSNRKIQAAELQTGPGITV